MTAREAAQRLFPKAAVVERSFMLLKEDDLFSFLGYLGVGD